MKEIKGFVEAFAKEEAELLTLQNKIDVSLFNSALPALNRYFVTDLYWPLGITMQPRSKASLLILGNIESLPPCNPRHLFKISKYKSNVYGNVWIAYLSLNKANLEFKNLLNALFIIKENSEYKIAKKYAYSDYESDGRFYQWEAREGYNDLCFDTLEGPIEIERYLEPSDAFDGLKNYNDNI